MQTYTSMSLLDGFSNVGVRPQEHLSWEYAERLEAYLACHGIEADADGELPYHVPALTELPHV